MPEHEKDDTAKLDALLARLVDETITPGELGELESLMDGRPEAQRRYLHYLGLHADLDEAGVPAEASDGSQSATGHNHDATLDLTGERSRINS